ncbi:CTR copper uptake transporter [Mycena leptocephala]|nr:CTR copper uptake transporter [Mycena leptocephala]
MLFPLLLIALASAPSAFAHGEASTTNSSMGSMMMTALHFTPLGDTLWFSSWAPQSGGAVAGACIGLFLLAIAERAVAMYRAMLSAQWALRVRRASSNPKARLQAPPFVPAYDVPRGALYALQALFGFAFMLVVMTFQAAYIIAVVAGFGVGEMLFGRYVSGVAGVH